MPFRRFALLHIYVCFETEEMAVHVAMNPPMAPTVEQDFVSELNRANAIIDQLIRTSLDVIRLIRGLQQNIGGYKRYVIRDDLRKKFEAAMNQENIPAEMVPEIARWHAYLIVSNIKMVLAKLGDSVVIYFLCENVRVLFKLGQMITSGFMHSVFAPAIEFLARRPTTVDVYVRANEFYFTLLCLSSPADKG